MSELLTNRATSQRVNIEVLEGKSNLSVEELVNVYSFYLADAYIQQNNVTFTGDADKDKRSNEIREKIVKESDEVLAGLFDFADLLIVQTAEML